MVDFIFGSRLNGEIETVILGTLTYYWKDPYKGFLPSPTEIYAASEAVGSLSVVCSEIKAASPQFEFCEQCIKRAAQQ